MRYIDPKSCQERLLKQDNLMVIDIREDYEYQQCNIGFTHIPMGEISSRHAEIPKENEIVIMCQSGRRAEAVVNLLETEYHFPNVFVMEGGINGWIEQVDPSLKQDE
ncbi:MAG: rhodanese-like domain-containing protein [Crocinitomicaceae bacterium]|jgi:rhodanese-related sulfurtransferase